MNKLILSEPDIANLRNSGALLVWAYCRVSTPRDQRPERQLELCVEWAKRETAARSAQGQSAVVVVGTSWEEGVSGLKTWALERAQFQSACASAKQHGCAAIVIEQRDRFSRRDPEEATWEKVEVKRRFDLAIWTADMSLREQATSFGGVVQFWKQTAGNDAMNTHAPRVKSGVALRRRLGLAVGGQTQAKVDDALVALVKRLHAENPAFGLRKLAHAASKERGAFDVDPSGPAFRRRRVSHTTVERLLRGQTWHQRERSAP